MMKMSILYRVLFLIAVVLCDVTPVYGISCGSYGDTVDITQSLNFGTILVGNPNTQAGITVQTNGSYSASNNIANPSGQTNAILRYTSGRLGNYDGTVNVTPSATLQCTSNCSSAASNCQINVTNINSDYTSQQIRSRSYKDFNIGGTITVPANCGSGTFTGTTTAQCSLTALWIMTGSCTPSIDISVTLRPQPLQITADNSQLLNFGTLLSGQAHAVTVSPNGTCTSSVPTMINDNSSCSAGRFYINKEEADPQQISLNVTSGTLTNQSGGSGSLSLSDFTLMLNGSQVSLNTNTQIAQTTSTLLVGAKLTIPADANQGDYEGTYTVTLSY